MFKNLNKHEYHILSFFHPLKEDGLNHLEAFYMLSEEQARLLVQIKILKLSELVSIQTDHIAGQRENGYTFNSHIFVNERKCIDKGMIATKALEAAGYKLSDKRNIHGIEVVRAPLAIVE